MLKTTTSSQQSSGKKMKVKIWRNRGLYVFLIPMVCYFIIFSVLPIYGLQIAFRDFKPPLGITGSPWVGLKYIKKFINSYSFLSLIKNTLTLSLYSLVICQPLALVLAVVLKYCPLKRMGKLAQTASFAPHFISVVVLVGMMKTFFMPGSGIVNVVLGKLGIEAIDFMGDPKLFPHMYAWSRVWAHTGYHAIVYVAALAGVSEDLHEAAIMDGASLLQRIRHIDLPTIMPMMVILLIMNVGNMLQIGSEKVLLMQAASNLSASEIISTYTYKIGLLSTQYSYSAAIGLFNNLVDIILLVAVNKIAQKLTETSLW